MVAGVSRQRGGHLDGENARQDGTRDADGSAVVQELEERVCSEEQLRDDEIRSGVHLLLQVLEVLLVALGFWVSGGVSCRRRPIRAHNVVLQQSHSRTNQVTEDTPATQMSK